MHKKGIGEDNFTKKYLPACLTTDSNKWLNMIFKMYIIFFKLIEKKNNY